VQFRGREKYAFDLTDPISQARAWISPLDFCELLEEFPEVPETDEGIPKFFISGAEGKLRVELEVEESTSNQRRNEIIALLGAMAKRKFPALVDLDIVMQSEGELKRYYPRL
jgi:hypothetical protein